jgi:DNA-nicking Smr family endonuclease
MKRSRPPQIVDPAPVRRKRALSEEERVLWDSVAKQTKPLRKKRKLVAKPPALVVDAVPAVADVVAPVTAAAKPAAVKTSAGKSGRAVALKDLAARVAPVVPPLAPIGRRERSQLSRGKKDIEARLDLHGMTQTRAYGALLSFLQRATRDGLTFVLVITGKGRTVGAESERGVLRRQVPEWLSLPEFRTMVVGFDEAHLGHGGGGALYVRVRRMR